MWRTCGLILDALKVVFYYTKKKSVFVLEQFGENGVHF